jgi:hypothetical protein
MSHEVMGTSTGTTNGYITRPSARTLGALVAVQLSTVLYLCISVLPVFLSGFQCHDESSCSVTRLTWPPPSEALITSDLPTVISPFRFALLQLGGGGCLPVGALHATRRRGRVAERGRGRSWWGTEVSLLLLLGPGEDCT